MAASGTAARSTQLIAQALGFAIAFTFVFVLSYSTFWVIKKTYGLRVTEDEEDAGLDISEHGMYGYPEQFIPQPEYPVGGGMRAPTPAPVIRDDRRPAFRGLRSQEAR